MEKDLSDVVRVLERIENAINYNETYSSKIQIALERIDTELRWYEKNTAASQIIDALNSIQSRLFSIESRLGDVEQAVREH